MRYDPHIGPKRLLSLRTNVAGKSSLISFKQLVTQYVTRHAAAQAAHTTIAGSNELF